jgi:hypothetical protein
MNVSIRDDLKVVIDEMPESRAFIFNPDDAVNFAMTVAEAAARCGFQGAQQAVMRHVEERMRSTVTEEIRVAMIQRLALVVPQLTEHKLTPGQFAMRCVDIVLNQAQGRTVA